MSADLLVVGEGHGEVEAVAILVARVLKAQGSFPMPFNTVRPPMRQQILGGRGLERACDVARAQRPAALLITSDVEDICPREAGPALAERVREQSLPFPVAVVLFYREYETLFISVASSLAGRTLHLTSGPLQLARDPELLADPESKRDAKGWVREQLMSGTAYKPRIHQKPMTDALDVDELRTADLSSFRRLERALTRLAVESLAGNAGVYPS